tara:strand:+ start:6189 stop:6416 length:228 start_codon:yes stop_codon:yes gene_type:complete
VAIHILLTNTLGASNVLIKIMDPIVFLTSFLVYSVAPHLQDTLAIFFLFALQFSFWLLVSVISFFIYEKVKKNAN